MKGQWLPEAFFSECLLAEGGTLQEAKSKQANTFEASVSVTSANIPWTEASPTSMRGGGRAIASAYSSKLIDLLSLHLWKVPQHSDWMLQEMEEGQQGAANVCLCCSEQLVLRAAFFLGPWCSYCL